MMWGGYGWEGFGAAIGTLIMLAIVALIVVGIVLLVRGLSDRPASSETARFQGPPSGDHASSSALRILEERYARGEVDRDEFLRRRQDLLGS